MNATPSSGFPFATVFSSHPTQRRTQKRFEVISETSAGRNKLYIRAFSPRQAAAINRRILSTVSAKIVSVREAI